MFRSELRTLDGVPPSRLLLATDFDGTLAPIVSNPADSRPLPAAVAAIARLRDRVAGVVLLSGRGSDDLERLLPLPGVRRRGDYGLGRPTADEAVQLDRLARELAGTVAAVPGAILERKPGSLSVHYRGAPEAGPALETATASAADHLGLRWHRGRLVVEVLPRRAGKAEALRREIEDTACAAVIYAGDDVGDAGCFQLLAGLAIPHLAIGVGSAEADPALFASCDMVLDGPPDLAAFLTALADWSEAPGRADPGSGG